MGKEQVTLTSCFSEVVRHFEEFFFKRHLYVTFVAMKSLCQDKILLQLEVIEGLGINPWSLPFLTQG